MLRQQKIYDEETPPNADTSASNVSDDTVFVDGKSTSTSSVPNKPTLMHTYSNLSDKSFAAVEPPYTLTTTLVQLNFVKSSFTVNPVMVSSFESFFFMSFTLLFFPNKLNHNFFGFFHRAHMRIYFCKVTIDCI